MYKYVENKQFLSRMRSLCGEIMQDLCHTLKEEYDIFAIAHYSRREVWTEETVNGSSGADTDSQ